LSQRRKQGLTPSHCHGRVEEGQIPDTSLEATVLLTDGFVLMNLVAVVSFGLYRKAWQNESWRGEE
jgi:hypothetical protein